MKSEQPQETSRDEAQQRPNRESGRRRDVLHCAATLEALARKIEQFLDGQFRRLEQVLEQCRRAALDTEAAGASQNDLDSERAAWQRQRDEEIRRIEQERARLAEAWERVEADQRALAAQSRSTRQRRAAGLAISPNGGHDEHRASPERERPTKEPGKSRPADADYDSSQSLDELVRQSVITQFQQLKNDVRKHAQRQNAR